MAEKVTQICIFSYDTVKTSVSFFPLESIVGVSDNLIMCSILNVNII